MAKAVMIDRCDSGRWFVLQYMKMRKQKQYTQWQNREGKNINFTLLKILLEKLGIHFNKVKKEKSLYTLDLYCSNVLF